MSAALAFPDRATRLQSRLATATAPAAPRPAAAPAKRKEPRNMNADKVKEIRAAAGLTQAGLAALLRLGASGKRTVRRWEAGEIPITGPASIVLEMIEAGELPAGYREGGAK